MSQKKALLVNPDDCKVTPHPDVVQATLENGEVVLLHLGTTQYYSLNETGSLVWHLLSRDLTLQGVSEHLEAEFDVAPDHARQSVTDLAEELMAEGLVHLIEG